MEEKLGSILSTWELEGHEGLIPLLQQVQEELGYVPQEAVFGISDRLGVPSSEVFGVLTFYAQFRLTPQGRHMIHVCQGTACHVMGSAKILAALQEHLGVRVGETTADFEFTLEQVRCLGSCSLAPVMTVDRNTYGRLTPEKALSIVRGYRNDADDH